MPINIVELDSKGKPKKPKAKDRVKPRHKDPNHPMNRERTGPSTLKEDPVYKKSGGKIYNYR